MSSIKKTRRSRSQGSGGKSSSKRGKSFVSKKGKISYKKSEPLFPVWEHEPQIKYRLSDESFIQLGWTVFPTDNMNCSVEKTVKKKIITYQSVPSKPTLFRRREQRENLYYTNKSPLAVFKKNGMGSIYYPDGHVAITRQKGRHCTRYTVLSPGGRDPTTNVKRFPGIRGLFDSFGNGVIYDEHGDVQLKYNQKRGTLSHTSHGLPVKWTWPIHFSEEKHLAQIDQGDLRPLADIYETDQKTVDLGTRKGTRVANMIGDRSSSLGHTTPRVNARLAHGERVTWAEIQTSDQLKVEADAKIEGNELKTSMVKDIDKSQFRYENHMRTALESRFGAVSSQSINTAKYTANKEDETREADLKEDGQTSAQVGSMKTNLYKHSFNGRQSIFYKNTMDTLVEEEAEVNVEGRNSSIVSTQSNTQLTSVAELETLFERKLNTRYNRATTTSATGRQNMRITTPIRPIILKLNEFMTLRITDQANVCLVFQAEKKTLRIELGVEVDATTPFRVDKYSCEMADKAHDVERAKNFFELIPSNSLVEVTKKLAKQRTAKHYSCC